MAQGPIIRNYKGGSIIYFEKDKADDIFVLQSGRVVLTFTSVNGFEVKEDVRLGEFFGVKSALGKFPREETAQVVGQATVLAFKVPEFEKFVSNKTHLIIKMLKVFSSQLRQVHRQVREILGQGEAKNPAFELMNVADTFHKNEQYEHAAYAYQQYINHYPNGNYAGRARDLAEFAKRNEPIPLSFDELTYKPEGKTPSKLQEMLNVPAESPKSASGGDDGTITSSFSKASTLSSAGKQEEALAIYKEISNRTDFLDASEEKLVNNSLFHMGKILYQLGQMDPANNTLTTYLKKGSNGDFVKDALFHMGLCAIKKNEKEKAITLFNKVVAMPPATDSLTESAKAKLKEIS